VLHVVAHVITLVGWRVVDFISTQETWKRCRRSGVEHLIQQNNKKHLRASSSLVRGVNAPRADVWSPASAVSTIVWVSVVRDFSRCLFKYAASRCCRS